MDLATNGTGAVMLDWDQRVNGEAPAQLAAAELLGEVGSDARGWRVVFRIRPEGGPTADYWRREERTGLDGPGRAYGLPGGLDVGETSPGIGPTIGAKDEPWDWAERLDAARAWRF